MLVGTLQKMGKNIALRKECTILEEAEEEDTICTQVIQEHGQSTHWDRRGAGRNTQEQGTRLHEGARNLIL